MRFAPIVIGVFIALCGLSCQPSEPMDAAGQRGVDLFAPASMRIHPIFTQVKDWTGDGNPDGIEALVEFQDQFGDPTKATGRVMFELYEYDREQPDAKDDRIANPWIGSLETIAEQRERWNRTSRTYGFQLALPGISTSSHYVLTAMFEKTDGGRFFDRVVLEPQRQEPSLGSSTTTPTTLPNLQPDPRTVEP